MIIKEFTIENYKCFHKPQPLYFDRGFNVIVGKNNAGKSALIQALSLRSNNASHKSLSTMRVQGILAPTPTHTQIKYVITKAEFRKELIKNQEFCFPPVLERPDFTYEDACRKLFDREEWEFMYSKSREDVAPTNICCGFDVYTERTDFKGAGFHVTVSETGDFKAGENVDNSGQSTPSYESFFSSVLHDGIYAFDPVLGNPHNTQANSNSVLESDAKNLAFVFMNIQGRQRARAQYDKAVHDVFPDIGTVTFENEPPGNPRMMVHPAGLSDTRPDLATPLSVCGTGITQALAMLYVVVEAETPRVIVIDEINSFLHPGAVRNLIEVLKSFRHHQYILTTHSPAVIAACDPATLTIIEQENGVSNFKQVDARRREDQTEVLYAVGANLSDVFGSDNILWVEGQTEEKAFPLIIKYFDIAPSSILTILPVRGTSDFMKNQAKAISDIYQRLSRADSLLPKTINFLLDTEKLSDAEKTERKKEVPILHFLPRRMYENYLLHAEAIAFVANNTDKLIDKLIDASIVEEWLEANHREGKYYTKQTPRKADWHEDVDSAKLLTDMFTDLFSDEHDYKKTRDSVELTKWLLDHDEAALSEVALLLERILRPVNETLNQPT